MKKARFFFSFWVLLISCSCKNKRPEPYQSDALKIKPLNNNVFAHISYLQTNDFGKVECNGMVYFNQDEAVVFDTPSDDVTSKELIEWIEKEQKKKIVAVVVTHFHIDCWGGLNQFHNSNIMSYASQKTIAIMNEKGLELLPQHEFNNMIEIKVGDAFTQVKHFGAGHTIDNMIGYVPEEKALFGGCLVKSVNASKGNLEDADVSEWSTTVEKIKQEFPDLEIVIPGHGKSGGIELLDYTIQLFE